MANRGVSLLIDLVMVASYLTLLAWRRTGVPIHEWLGVGLLALIVIHLVIHWGWVESRVRQAFERGSRRTRANVLLNASLFLSMGTTIVSGFFISKVIVPNALGPGLYLGWHGLHDGASVVTVLILGLHLALNWDVILSVGRRGLRPRPAIAPSAARRAFSVRSAARRLAWVAAAFVVVAIGTAQAGRVLPADRKVMLIRPGGHAELVAPPPEITKLRPGTERPAADAPIGRATVNAGLLCITCLVGRKVLKIRLG